jgi:sugar lactone lactonase YvrE
VLGISEYKPNVFAVAVGNFSASTVTGTAGSWSIWSLDLSAFSVTANKITTIPAAEFLNGVTTITSREIVLAADSAQGVIYRVDAAAGTWTVAFDDLALKPNMTATYQIGVNGIVVHGSYLYFDNSGQAPLLGRFALNADGTPSGAAEIVVAEPDFPANAAYHGFDDFTFDSSGNVWLATNPSRQIVKISPAGAVTVEAGNLQDTTLKGCTSLQFGRTASDRHVLYVNVNGAGGKLLAADIFG